MWAIIAFRRIDFIPRDCESVVQLISLQILRSTKPQLLLFSLSDMLLSRIPSALPALQPTIVLRPPRTDRIILNRLRGDRPSCNDQVRKCLTLEMTAPKQYMQDLSPDDRVWVEATKRDRPDPLDSSRSTGTCETMD